MRSSRLKTLGLSAGILALTTVAGIAYAASERYDSAQENIDKAIALLKAIENPAERPAEKHHRYLAIRQLEGASQQIDKAKAAADKAAPAPAPRKPKKAVKPQD